jgi:lincosamide nucleotidyltransferase A/C/D/E
MTAEDASELYGLLRRANIRCWVMGGWGVDALVGSQTRAHHDLDVLVLADDLRSLRRLFDERGFAIEQVWDAENRLLDVEGDTWPTAFVAADNNGIELDVACLAARTQLMMHDGYELPEAHKRDLELLRELM